jgi:quercetin dioxygenase-like cupin family protein
MSVRDTAEITPWETHPGCLVRVVGSGERMTMLYGKSKPGTEIPEHKHPHEQLGFCFEGQATYKIGNKTFLVKKGHSFLIPPNVVHSAKVGGKKEYVVVEVFSPTRPDLLKGEFAPEKSEE